MTHLSFAAPWLLGLLAVLPVLFWLLRLTPPTPRRLEFPGVALLLGLQAREVTPSRTPWWLLLLRLAAAALVIVGFAGPVRNAPRPLAGSRPVLLVVDNGWGAAPDWAKRLRAAEDAMSRIAAPAAPARLLATADAPDGTRPAPGAAMTVADLAARLAVQRPLPWPPDRAAAAAALATLPRSQRVIYVSDGIATAGPDDAAFIQALSRFAAVTELRAATAPVLLRPVTAGTDRLELRGETLPSRPTQVTVRAEDGQGRAMTETTLDFPAGGGASAGFVLPPALRNRVAALRVAGQASAGAVLLLDEGARRRPVGLLSQGTGQNEPLTGPLYFLRQALAATTELRGGDLRAVLAGGVSVIMLADETVGDPAEQKALTDWVRGGGVLVRFAGPNLAAETGPDPLLPVALVGGDRALGGAMSWNRPAPLASFPADGPFAGLPVPGDVRVSRQVLAQPGDAPDHPGRQDWATLADGTPLVTAAPLGAGHLVLFHVTANADWSNLPLSGLFPRMLQRLVALSVGLRTPPTGAAMAPRLALDGFGQTAPPGPAAQRLTESEFGRTIASPAHPPGLYGPEDETRAFNLGAALPPLRQLPLVPGAAEAGLNLAAHPVPYGPFLLAAATALLALDLGISLFLRGLLTPVARSRAMGGLILILAAGASSARAQAIPTMPSLANHLAYVITGDAETDQTSLAGLKSLSAVVNNRTAAVLSDPVGVDPARDELTFYPLLYWPVLPDAPLPDGATLARLDDYMQDGGIILFDTRDAGAPNPGADLSLRQLGAALSLPALARLTTSHVLTRTFYLLRAWPGRFDDGTAWVARDAERTNDGVSPVVLGADDWAGAWAEDEGDDMQADSDTPSRQELAFRFGVNLVMYALTGNYKADQVHVPELLRRLGQDAGTQDQNPDSDPP
jgi:hypothetical protein